jgi:Domain of unknown function (DUF1877)
MAIDAELVRIKPQNLKELIQDSDCYLLTMYDYKKMGQSSVWIGVYWQVIHYVLTREIAWPGYSLLPTPLCNIILGGKLVHPKNDTIRYLNSSEVKDVANFLKKYPVSWVEKEFYEVKDQPIEIYRMFMEEDELPGLLLNYERFCSIYFEAAEAGDAMLIQID